MNEAFEATQERRSEPREILEQYHSIEIELKKNLPVFQFQLWDISPSSLGVLVKADSEVLVHLEVDQTVDMQCNPRNPHDSARHIKAEIRHITRMAEGRFRGHYLVGFAVLKDD
ncbi:MAG: hypothetical protein U5R49_13275 [Deltaproteobacteria bacterium]|nr:hypothetical protein [Deltaproteobacteria bacterium]